MQPPQGTVGSPSFGHPSPDTLHPAEDRLAAAGNPLALFAEVAEDHRPGGDTSTYPSPHHEAEQVVELLRGDLDPSLAELKLNLSICKSSLLTVMAPQLFKGEPKATLNRLHELAVRDVALVRRLYPQASLHRRDPHSSLLGCRIWIPPISAWCLMQRPCCSSTPSSRHYIP
jgi:hypothetical protein